MGVRARKLVEIIIPYMRVVCFVFIFFIVFTFFVAYNINYAANQSGISEDYSIYFLCLFGLLEINGSVIWPWECQLGSSASASVSLAMLKGFALSCLGVLVAFNWLSWSVIKHWAILLSTILGLVWTRDRLLLTKLWDLVYSVDNSLFAA